MGFFNKFGTIFGFTDSDDENEELTDETEEDEESDDEEGEEEEERGSFFGRLFGNIRKKNSGSDYTQSDEEQPPVKTPSGKSGHVRDGNIIVDPRLNSDPEEHRELVVRVHQIDECREIIKFLLSGDSVLLNLENVDPKDCGRIVDLLSGAAFALSGTMVKVAHLSYLLAPVNVKVIEMDGNGYGMNSRSRYQ